MKLLRWHVLARALAAGLMLSACGGGVETGGTGAYIEGPVAGFGSVIVNGVRLDERGARIEDAEGRPQPAAALQLLFDRRVRVPHSLSGEELDRLEELSARPHRRIDVQAIFLTRDKVVGAVSGAVCTAPVPASSVT